MSPIFGHANILPVVLPTVRHDGGDLLARQFASQSGSPAVCFFIINFVVLAFCNTRKHEVADLPYSVRQDLLLIRFPRGSYTRYDLVVRPPSGIPNWRATVVGIARGTTPS